MVFFLVWLPARVNWRNLAQILKRSFWEGAESRQISDKKNFSRQSIPVTIPCLDSSASAPSNRQPVVNKCVEKYSAHISHITAMLRVVPVHTLIRRRCRS